MTYSQSAAILALNRHLGASRASQALFALGDCIYDKDSPRYLAYKADQGKAGELRHAGAGEGPHHGGHRLPGGAN